MSEKTKFEPPVIKRYGQNWNFNCRIRASESKYIYPGAEGQRDEHEYNANLDIDFNLKMFTKPTFRPEDIFGNRCMVDISVNSDEGQLIYGHFRTDYFSKLNLCM